MQIANARFNMEGQIEATVDGVLATVPTITGNRVYDYIVANAVAVSEYAPPTIEQEREGMHLTFAQLLIGLVEEGWILEAEGDAWLAGTLPPRVLAVIASMPPANRFRARARAIRPSIVSRIDPLVIALAVAEGKTPPEIDTFFATYAGV